MEKLQVGIQVLHIGGRDAILPGGQLVVERGAQVEQDAFVDKSENGFFASVKRQLAVFGRGKMPENFFLVVAERLEDTYLAFSGGSVTRYLDEVLDETKENSIDETGDGYKETDSEYIPVLVCVLGYSKSFQHWCWQKEEQPTYQAKHPIRVFSREQFEKVCNKLNVFHSGIVTD